MSSDLYRPCLSRNLVSVGALAYRENSARRPSCDAAEMPAHRHDRRSLRPVLNFVATPAFDQIADPASLACLGRSRLRTLAAAPPPSPIGRGPWNG